MEQKDKPPKITLAVLADSRGRVGTVGELTMGRNVPWVVHKPISNKAIL